MNDKEKFHGPQWDIVDEYSNLLDPRITADIGTIESAILEIEKVAAPLSEAIEDGKYDDPQLVSIAQRIFEKRERIAVLISNLSTYVGCVLSVNGDDNSAKNLQGQVEGLKARYAVATSSFTLWATLTSDDAIRAYLDQPQIASEAFYISRLRLMRSHVLPLAEENLLKKMEVHGPIAFGHLYDSVSTSLRCEVKVGKNVRRAGLAEAAKYLSSSDESVRFSAFDGINKAWESQQEACSAILNNLTGWRQEVFKMRSYQKPLHYLTSPLQRSCIEKKTLDAMLSTVERYKDIPQRVLKIQAKLLGKERLGPWDLFAPAPIAKEAKEQRWTFDEGIALIKQAFTEIDPKMGDFVTLMVKNRWIEGTVQGNKRPGAYCTKFLKTRTPRVYMTYAGTMNDVSTLAHEIGHAFHSWVMRDLGLAELSYPMTLAETASIMAETVLSSYMYDSAGDDQSKLLPLLWNSASDSESFMLNIPARFTFEAELNERGAKGPLAPSDLKQMMTAAWQKWYGDGLSEMNPMFWASKLHFHISSLSFYNFPYTFGYLFSLGVYAQRERLGKDFYATYVNLLRDTGRMSAEALAQKYLESDISQPEFWERSIKIVEKKVSMFEKVALASK